MQIAQIAELGPRFTLPLEALVAIRAQSGRARMLEHAIESDDTPPQLVALVLELKDSTLVIKLLTEQVEAQRRGNLSKVRRLRQGARRSSSEGASKLLVRGTTCL